MDDETYSKTLLQILRKHSVTAQSQLRKALSSLPEKATAMNIGVHPNQEPDGMFSILIHIDGPDLYSLNKAISDYRYLFHVRYQDGVVTPEVPMFDPFDTEFEVNDVIVDTALIWLRELFSDFKNFAGDLPVTVFGEDGYGTRTPAKIG